MYQKGNKRLIVLSLYNGEYSAKLYLREISRLSGLPLKTTQNTVSELENENILKSSTEGKNKYFMLNLDNIQTKFYMEHSELNKTAEFTEKYMSFKTFLKEGKNLDNPIMVFGSFAKLEATEDSDLDLFIISNKKISLPYHLLPYKIHEIILSEDNFFKGIKSGETLIKEVIKNHVILNNHSFFINVMWGKHAK